MESELRHRDTKTTIEEDSSDTLSSSSLNEEYHGDIKKDMRYSYGKTPDGKGLQSDNSVPNLKLTQFVSSLSSTTYPWNGR